MKYKAIVSDVDDTLTEAREGALPSTRVISAINRVQKEGIIFTLATGRPLIFVEEIIKKLDLKAPIIVEGGATIYHPVKKKIIWKSVIASEKALRVIDILSQETQEFVVIDDGERIINPKKIKHGKVTKIGVYGLSADKAKKLIHKLGEIKIHAVESSSWSGEDKVYLHITNSQATKQQAIYKLARYLEISTKEIIGVGDHYNDFPLLMACGFRVAMGNAVKDLKEIADYIAPTLANDGLADVIEKFVLSTT